MAMKNINIITAIPLNYTLAGDDKDASATQNEDAGLTFKTSSGNNGNFVFNSRGTILKARLLSNFGIRPPQGKLAAELVFGIFGIDGTKIGEFNLPLVEWDTWEEKDINISSNSNGYHTLKLLSGSVIRVYDSNVQSDYVGDVVKPMLELEVTSFQGM